MYFEVSGVSKHKLGGMRDKWKIQEECEMWNTGYGIKINILGCAECAHFNQEIQDKFDIHERNAGCIMKKKPSKFRPTK